MSELKNWENYSSESETEDVKKVGRLDISDDLSVYNERECEYLDRYLPLVKNAFDETELYEIIVDCKFNDEKIKEIIHERVKILNAKGDVYGWKVVGKTKQKVEENNQNQTQNYNHNRGKFLNNF